MEQHTYRYLQTLKDSDFQIVDQEPDIIGWEVKSASGSYIGEVQDLLCDPQSWAVRYLIIDLSDKSLNLGAKTVMIPIGIAYLHTSDDEVILPNVSNEQLNALPDYKAGYIGPDTEVYIRSVFEDPIQPASSESVNFDQHSFYGHERFDKQQFYTRGGQGPVVLYEQLDQCQEVKPWLNPDGSPKDHPDAPIKKEGDKG